LSEVNKFANVVAAKQDWECVPSTMVQDDSTYVVLFEQPYHGAVNTEIYQLHQCYEQVCDEDCFSRTTKDLAGMSSALLRYEVTSTDEVSEITSNKRAE
jgi:hypothetical protein